MQFTADCSVDTVRQLDEVAAYPSESSILTPSLLALALGSFAIGTTEFLPAALLPTIAGSLEVSLASAGLLVSGYAMGVTLLTPILTVAFSGWSKKELLILLMSVFVVTNLLSACAPNFWFLLAVRFITAFSHGVYFAVASITVSRIAPKGREAEAIAILFAGLTIAMATVVPSGAFIGQLLGWKVAFAATATLGLFSALGIWLYVPKLALQERPLSLREQLSALKVPRLLLVLGMTTVAYAGTFATFTYLAATLEHVTGFHSATVPILFALVGLGVTIGNLIGGRIADYGLHRAMTVLFSVLAASLLFLWVAGPSMIATIPALVLFSIVMFSPGPGLQLLAVQQAQRFLPGAENVAAGLNQSAFNLGIAIGAFIGGKVVASPLGLAATPLFSSGIVVMAIGLTLLSWKCEQPKAVCETK